VAQAVVLRRQRVALRRDAVALGGQAVTLSPGRRQQRAQRRGVVG
jgi:hypothetical protein